MLKSKMMFLVMMLLVVVRTSAVFMAVWLPRLSGARSSPSTGRHLERKWCSFHPRPRVSIPRNLWFRKESTRRRNAFMINHGQEGGVVACSKPAARDILQPAVSVKINTSCRAHGSRLASNEEHGEQLCRRTTLKPPKRDPWLSPVRSSHIFSTDATGKIRPSEYVTRHAQHNRRRAPDGSAVPIRVLAGTEYCNMAVGNLACRKTLQRPGAFMSSKPDGDASCG